MIIPWKSILKTSCKFKLLFVGSMVVIQQENSKGGEFALGIGLKMHTICICKVGKYYQSISYDSAKSIAFSMQGT